MSYQPQTTKLPDDVPAHVLADVLQYWTTYLQNTYQPNDLTEDGASIAWLRHPIVTHHLDDPTVPVVAVAVLRSGHFGYSETLYYERVRKPGELLASDGVILP